MSDTPSDDCIRCRVIVGGENYYLSIGRDFVHPTVPRENDPQMNRTRNLVESICRTITEALEKLNGTDKTKP